MRMIREVLRLHYSCGLGKNKLSRSLGCSHQTVTNYINRARAAGLAWPLPAEFDDDDRLEQFLYPKTVEATTPGNQKPQPDCNYIHKELKKKGVTLVLLWEEYRQDHPNGYQLSQFCGIYKQWRKTIDLVMRQDHKAGEKAFSDFAGGTLNIVNERSGEVTPAHLFVCALGASSYTYARLFWKEDTESWCTGHALAFTFFQGCPIYVVPDNPKPVTTKACRYEPDINPSFAQMANHFDVAVTPARVRKPRGRVNDWRGCFSTWGVSVFRLLSHLASVSIQVIAPFPVTAHQTGHAHLAHPAFTHILKPSLSTGRHAQAAVHRDQVSHRDTRLDIGDIQCLSVRFFASTTALSAFRCIA